MRYLPLVLLLCSASMVSGQTKLPADGRIAFTRVRENVMVPGNFRLEAEIWVMNADGTDQRRLTRNTSDDFGIAWSPDGKRLLFGVSQFEPDSSGELTLRTQDLYMVDAAGGPQRRFGLGNIRAQFPSWSADGRTIVFHGRDGDAPHDIFLMDADGSNVRRLTRDPASDARPDWSPDGSRIVFQSNRGGSLDIYVMNADGTNIVQLTHGDSAAVNQSPAWSPDGRRILFQSTRDGNGEIYVMNSDGSGQTRLTNYPLRDLDSEWAGDDFIIFDRDLLVNARGAEREVKQIFRMRADGTQVEQITSMPSSNSHAAWYGVAKRSQGPSLPTARANPNTTAAGTANGNVVSINLVAQKTRWHPEADDGPSVDVEAFGEEGGPPLVPGPLVRVAVGTLIDVSVRNTLPDTLLVFGLGAASDTLRIPPGDIGRTRATRSAAGTYAYGGATIVGDSLHLLGTGNQLLGAIVVDDAGAPGDRIFVISIWPPEPGRFVMAINGKSWPHTERLDVTVGDSTKWRLINGTRGRHPMHLHGFFFRIDSRGSWFADTALTGVRPNVVTESVPFRGTYTMTWTAERAGNWLFHCHDALHTTWRRRYNLIDERPPAVLPMHHGADHMAQDMSGLVLGIRARNRDGSIDVQASAPAQHVLRIAVNEKPRVYGNDPAFAYVDATAAEPARDSIVIPARPLILTRGVPTAITVMNRLSIATAVHWHGMELESFSDGVAGWSGDGTSSAPLIAPGDSFTARMTPPRAGTFMFHAHVDDVRQIALGLYGPLIVLPPGETWNPARDHVFIMSQMGRGQRAVNGVNGSAAPAPMTLAAGVPHRFRFINISVEHDATFTLLKDSAVVSWRAIAKDGADLDATRAVNGPATLLIAPGETYDYEVVLRPGTYRLNVDTRDDVTITINAVASPPLTPR